jgi:hypothetical protein
MYRRADVPGSGAREPRVESLAMPKSVESGKLSVNKVGIRWMSDKLASPSILQRFSRLSGNAAWLGPKGRKNFSTAVAFPIIKLALNEPTLSPRELAVRFSHAESYFPALRASASS